MCFNGCSRYFLYKIYLRSDLLLHCLQMKETIIFRLINVEIAEEDQIIYGTYILNNILDDLHQL